MAHFAEIDETNTVLRVIVVHNNELLINGVESEDAGIAFCRSLYGENTNWVQTSYNGSFRERFAGEGCVYDAELDAFINPEPIKEVPIDVPSRPTEGNWVLNKETFVWEEVL
jgi:hypothetical protein